MSPSATTDFPLRGSIAVTYRFRATSSYSRFAALRRESR